MADGAVPPFPGTRMSRRRDKDKKSSSELPSNKKKPRGILAVILAVAGVIIVACIIIGVIIWTQKPHSSAPASEDATVSQSNTQFSVQPSNKDVAILYQECSEGIMLSCDQLYFEAPVGSEEEAFGDTCGNTQNPGSYCQANPDRPQSTPQS